MLQAIVHIFENKAQTDEKIRRYVIVFVAIVALLPSIFLVVQMHTSGNSYRMSYLYLKRGKVITISSLDSGDIKYQTLISEEVAIVTARRFESLVAGPFCTTTAGQKKYPLGDDSPDVHVPWVWDAVESVGGKYVYVIVVDHMHCAYDRKVTPDIGAYL